MSLFRSFAIAESSISRRTASRRGFAPRGILVLLAGFALVGPAGCGSSDSKPKSLDIYNGPDATVHDATPEAEVDADAEVNGDAEVDADAEAGVDAEADADVEAGVDAEAGADAEVDAELDGPQDDAADAELDSQEAAAPACDDGIQNGDEGDVDCGGSCPDACGTGLKCNAPADCVSLSCPGGTCLAPTCSDGIENGTETDVDCGDAVCGPCSPGKKCTASVHCTSGVCDAGICQSPTCTDGVKNGNETDKDCGGSCPTDCPIGQKCSVGTDCISKLCQSNMCACPTGMAIVPVLGGGAFCVDSTEVTWSMYASFVLANPPTSGQPAICSWNSTYVPSQNWPPAANNTTPVAYVDWCDALAYCSWAEKRLCAKVSGGPNGFADFANATKSEWFNACSAQGVNTFPYGDTYNALQCFGQDSSVSAPQDVKLHSVQTPGCIGGVPGLFDMSGNVAEWEDSCSTQAGATDPCRVRGGSYLSTDTALQCDGDAALPRNSAQPDIGFRCCL